MKEILVITLVFGIASLSLLAAWFDHKYNWRLIDWFSGHCNNPFVTAETKQLKQKLNEKDQRIEALTERIQVLEKIVTEPAYELNQKINQL